MIFSMRDRPFSFSHIAVIKWPTVTTGCVVCTAPEGEKGCSTIFQLFEGGQWNAPGSNLRLVAKAWLSPTLSRAQVAEVHNLTLDRIELAMVINKYNVEKAVTETVKAMEELGVAVAPDIPLPVEQPDIPLSVEQMEDGFDRSKLSPGVGAATRLLALLNEGADRRPGARPGSFWRRDRRRHG